MARFILMILLAILVANSSFAATNTVIINNGDWANAGTWSLGTIPATGDIVIVPAGMTVQITTNMYNSPPQPVITINVNGILLMTSAGQLNLGAGSVLYVIGAGMMPGTGCNCNQLNFDGGSAEWKGNDPGLMGGSCLPVPCVPLSDKEKAVQVVKFEGETKHGKSMLKWTTENEKNMDHYEIEKSADGIVFENKGSVEAAGKSHNDYSFTDENSDNISYYRLKEVEKDNTITYSALAVVRKEVSFNSLEVFPNPASAAGQINIRFTPQEEKEEVLLVLEDMMGKRYFSKVVILESDSTFVIENTETLNPGIYLIIASSDHKYYSEKILVQ